MTVLAFDCAISGLAVAVVRDGVGLAERREEGRGQAAGCCRRSPRPWRKRASIDGRCR